MKTRPIVPARIAHGPDGVPWSPDYGDVYHPRSGALGQAHHVFLGGNGLPARWAGRTRFVILETGFGLGNNFLATWLAWRADTLRCERLHFLSIEAHPLRREDLAAVPREPALAELAAELVAAWPPLTCNLHRIDFADGRVQLSLCFGDVVDWLPALVAQVDAYYLDGFAPAHNPQMWQPRLFNALARLAAPEATAATWSAARSVREGLATAGFEVTRAPGRNGKRDITLARYAPRFVPRQAPARHTAHGAGARRALIVGGGLAGAATAWALAQQGWHSSILDRHADPAHEASGNPAGLYRGIVNPQDGAHARFNRAAALQARHAVAEAIARRDARGATTGLIRLETSTADAGAMRAVPASLGLPPDYVEVLDAQEAGLRAGMTLRHPAWFYPGGGWVEPKGLVRAFIARAGARTRWCGSVRVDRIEAVDDGWQLLDVHGATVDCAAVVVLANAGDALRLLAALDPVHPPEWPLEAIRGQLTQLPVASFEAAGATPPRLPVAGAGYLLPALDGSVCLGATAQPGDLDPTVRLADHRANLAQLDQLMGRELELDPARATGRTAWRWSSRDRLPVIGAVPDLAQLANVATSEPRRDQPRFVPRRPGLFVFTALGSRGITWSALGAQVVASWVSGAPMPLEADLLDAVDPARFVVRAMRRGQR